MTTTNLETAEAVDPRSSIPTYIAIMAIQVLDWQLDMNNPVVVETLRAHAPKLRALATDLFSISEEVGQ